MKRRERWSFLIHQFRRLIYDALRNKDSQLCSDDIELIANYGNDSVDSFGLKIKTILHITKAGIETQL